MLFEALAFAGDWIHARRYFADALKALPQKEHEAAKEMVAYEAIKRIGAIYHLDNQLADICVKAERQYRRCEIQRNRLQHHKNSEGE